MADDDSLILVKTSGAKIFSSHAGAPTDRKLWDTEEDLYIIQKAQIPPIPAMQTAIDTNNTVIEQAVALGVNCYIFVPCIVCKSLQAEQNIGAPSFIWRGNGREHKSH